MKSVGQQLQEARLAKNWTPELAARETKIRADRVRDLEADDYTNFSSPTYARGFVRTYARALGLDEYRILRQLDNKLPEDDNASFAPDNGSMPYVPEPSTQAMHVSSAPRTGLYVVFGLGVAVTTVIAFVLLQAYRAGELQRYFANTAAADTSSMTSSASGAPADGDSPPHALPVDPNDTTHSVRAQPVDLNALATTPVATPAANGSPVAPAPASSDPVTNVAALSATTAGSPDPSSPAAAVSAPTTATTTTAPTDPTTIPPAPGDTTPVQSAPPAPPPTEALTDKAPPRALPVDPSELVAANQSPAEGPINPSDPPTPSNGEPSPADGHVGPTPVPTTAVDLSGPSPVAVPVDIHATKRLVLTASRDSFIKVTSLDSSSREILYASVLHTGQSLEFDGRKFSVNVGVPSAVDIMLDGVNYGPHSDHETPETFTLQSRQP